ncbi:MAG: class I SAM-dependent methyltransferase [Pseudomonadota bacterium]
MTTRLPVGEAYDKIVDLWREDRFNNENGVTQHVRALAFLSATGTALNVGCGGNTRFNALLRGAGLTIHGIDVSAGMLAMARENDPEVTLLQADIVDWALPQSYEFITAWDSLWHVSLDSQTAVMSKLMANLPVGGVFIFSAGGLDSASEHTDAAMGPEVYYSTLGIPETLRLVGACDCVCRHMEFDQYPEKHVYYIVQKIAKSES